MKSTTAKNNPSMTILGVMSGSSLDGIDVAVVEVSDDQFDIKRAATLSIDAELQAKLKNYVDLDSTGYLVLERDWSQFLGERLKTYISTIDIVIDAIGLHGHTIVHVPEEKMTVQLGNGGVISAITGLDVVADFRIQDVTKNGVGTPLVSIVDLNLFPGYDYYLNLGGIANITKIENTQVTAYDICPCNQVLNYISETKLGLPFDDEGKTARSGILLEKLMSEIDLSNYWKLSPPKSLDNNWIKDKFISKLDVNGNAADLLYTVTEWVTTKIADQISLSNSKILVTGGGAFNTFLIDRLRINLPQSQIVIPHSKIIEYKESVLMAYLAYKRILGQPNVLKMVTHAESDSIAGAYYKA